MAIRKITAVQLERIVEVCEMPAYGIPEAAHYLRVRPATLKSWVQGRKYPTKHGDRLFRPVINLPDKDVPILSFFNLAEAHVLSAFHKQHHIELGRIRAALDYVTEKFGWKHPLIEQRFETDGVALFIEKLGAWGDASARGQIVMQTIREYFQRLERAGETVVRLYPFTRSTSGSSPRCVFIDPRFSSGKPSLFPSHVPTAIIAERYKSGESIGELAKDYGCERLEIEEGLRCELEIKAAA